MILKFYKEDNRWYADIPDYIALGGTKEELEMVAGADAWLDIISQGESSTWLTIDSKDFSNAEKLYLEYTEELIPEWGATYRVSRYQGIDFSNLQLWLCPVTLFVFGEYPKVIYYK